MKRPLWLAVLILSFLSLASAEPPQTRSFKKLQSTQLKGQVLVKYKDGVGANRVSTFLAQKHNVRSLRQISKLGVNVLPVPAGVSPDQFLSDLRRNPDVEYAHFNSIMQAFDSPDDPRFIDNSQFYLRSGYLNAPAAWDISTGSPTVIVAVLDSGVILNHQDIDGSLWTNPTPVGGVSGLRGAAMLIDFSFPADGDCLDTDPTYGPEQCAGDDPEADDVGEWHGTHVAGIIAAETNNTLNMAGIARSSKIMAVKVLNSSGYGTVDSIADGIIYAVDNGATIINMSLGGPGNDPTLANAVAYAINNDVVVVAAAGNDGPNCPLNYPAAYDSVISVGAIESNYSLATFSCAGTGIDVVAPGVAIISLTDSNGTSALSGTSFSAPMVAGVAALIRSVQPSADILEVTRLIDHNAIDLGASGYDTTYGFGMVSAFQGVDSALNGTIYTSAIGSNDKAIVYPNPYRPFSGLKLNFQLPNSLGRVNPEITIYTAAGEEVKKLTNTLEWDGKSEDGNFVASGLYYFIAKTSAGDAKGKLTVIK